MPSNPTTLAELVEALERRAQQISGAAKKERTYEADLMERAAKALRAVPWLLVSERRRNEALIREYPGYESSDVGARSIAAARLGLIDAIEAAITRALGSSDAR